MSIRTARPDDVPRILDLIRALAEYEKQPDAVAATEADLHAALFADDHVAGCLLAEADGAVVGIALWFRTFSTWTGKPGIWLEDLFVQPEHRGSGLGAALLAGLARLCLDRGYPRLEWTVLDWNEPAIGFYRAIGAVGQEEWTTQRVDGTALASLADRSSGFAT